MSKNVWKITRHLGYNCRGGLGEKNKKRWHKKTKDGHDIKLFRTRFQAFRPFLVLEKQTYFFSFATSNNSLLLTFNLLKNFYHFSPQIGPLALWKLQQALLLLLIVSCVFFNCFCAISTPSCWFQIWNKKVQKNNVVRFFKNIFFGKSNLVVSISSSESRTGSGFSVSADWGMFSSIHFRGSSEVAWIS